MEYIETLKINIRRIYSALNISNCISMIVHIIAYLTSHTLDCGMDMQRSEKSKSRKFKPETMTRKIIKIIIKQEMNI